MDLRYIQGSLGHKRTKTTGISTYVKKKLLGKMKTLLDILNLKKEVKICQYL